MLLEREKRTFKKNGQDITYDVYFVEIYGRKVELTCARIEDKNLLRVGFDNECIC